MSQTSLIREIVRLQPASPEYEDLRTRVLAREPDALMKWVYYSVWRMIKRDKSIPVKQRIPAFKNLLSKVDIQVEIDG